MTWINMYLLFASELISTSIFIKASPDDNGPDKKTMNPTHYIDIKSEGLRDILRTILRDIRANNLSDDKPAV